ncbi:PQQ-dependent dehydrogenase, methanol/ethanol family [Sphingobium nicotianae]|uniref:PQQ-dependent dehydrogenase, methanol/ethanol family n=1 Tax=Sphingobium nicotianae TaxID=2782607 RepID=A0A9X1DA19_9SPHN|nr:PQQ-dependent dehydrogenase, methanol/ethanol family [Sphingobium nicotianae]MBT2186063.1 PQQ-dependent dehydrogenase, methanol/ethanol family [Sphingobium nicotianae]
MKLRAQLILWSSIAILSGCDAVPSSRQEGAVTEARLVAAGSDTDNWLTTGRTYNEQRHSPLTKINSENVGRLGLAWSADLDTARGQEATPLAIDGTIYISTAWSMVKAYDGKSGKLLWSYDPKVPRDSLVKACCDAVNRGVAAWGDRIFVGTLDGRLVALDRRTGKLDWEVVTVDQSQNYTITGAPRVIKGKVIIGNGGAEFGVRGYITAYDVDNGKPLWRFYTVPGDPAKGFEGAHLEAAAKTWKGTWWTLGGGGTVWDSMAYDPDLDLLYIGVGNGSPWNQAYRSPGGGDNLYLSSIVALHPENGKYAWHYQTTPGETWDYTATQHMILADLKWGGKPRKVIMQAPKNGYFYVLDRTNGKLLSAKAYAPMNWSTEVDMTTGRPIENPNARYDKTGKPWVSVPGATGAHGWPPMSFSPETGFVYIPVQDTAFPYAPEKGWVAEKMGYNVGNDLASGSMPADPAVRKAAIAATTGALIAWDPVGQREVWRVKRSGPSNGGVLSTAGDLVFQGTAAGRFEAFKSKDGVRLWSTDVQTGVLAAPITYAIDGEQYVAVLVGWGGIWGVAPGVLSQSIPNVSRLLVYKLGGKATLPALVPVNKAPLDPPASKASSEQIAKGKYLFARFCGACHGDAAVGGTINPDLRRSGVLGDQNTWQQVVRDGLLKDNGMVSFKSVLNVEQVESIRQFVIRRANEDRAIEVGQR